MPSAFWVHFSALARWSSAYMQPPLRSNCEASQSRREEGRWAGGIAPPAQPRQAGQRQGRESPADERLDRDEMTADPDDGDAGDYSGRTFPERPPYPPRAAIRSLNQPTPAVDTRCIDPAEECHAQEQVATAVYIGLPAFSV
jgi:hypothetical protein